MDKILRAGTPGDYPPFSFFNNDSGNYEGLDIDLVQMLADDLNIKFEFVKFSWQNLINDLLNEKFDFAIGGITSNIKRRQYVSDSISYMTTGTCPLVRTSDRDRYNSLETIDRKDVRLILNKGGSNDLYFSARFKSADIIRHDINHEIAGKIKNNSADVWITDNVEALYWAGKLKGLTAVNPSKTFTEDQKVCLARHNEPGLMEILNSWLKKAGNRGEIDRLRLKWLGNKNS